MVLGTKLQRQAHSREGREHVYSRKQVTALLQEPVRLVRPGVDVGNHEEHHLSDVAVSEGAWDDAWRGGLGRGVRLN